MYMARGDEYAPGEGLHDFILHFINFICKYFRSIFLIHPLFVIEGISLIFELSNRYFIFSL